MKQREKVHEELMHKLFKKNHPYASLERSDHEEQDNEDFMPVVQISSRYQFGCLKRSFYKVEDSTESQSINPQLFENFKSKIKLIKYPWNQPDLDLSEYYQNWKGSEPVMPNVLPLSPNAMFADVKPMSPGIRVFHFFHKGQNKFKFIFIALSQNKAHWQCGHS